MKNNLFFGLNKAQGSGPPPSTGLLTNLVAYWKMEEATDAQVLDSHGAYDSVANGADSNSSGIIDNCYEFPQSPPIMRFGNVLDYDDTDAFSFSAWVYFYANNNASNGSQCIVSKITKASNTEGYLFMKRADTTTYKNMLQVTLRRTGSYYIAVYGSTVISINTWHHIVLTYSGSGTAAGVKIYIDGVEESYTVASDTLSGSFTNSANFNIGSRDNDDLNLYGRIDEVGHWDREISSSDVTTLYNSGSGLSYDDF
jgi:hypothetical protein